MEKKLYLGKNKEHYALVDEKDYLRLKGHHWIRHKQLGYAYRQERRGKKKKTYYLHREVLGLSYGDGMVVDHIDRNPLNCKRDNLRAAKGHKMNAQNKPSFKGSSSRFRGVRKRGTQFEAYVHIEGKQIHVGRFEKEVDAAIAVHHKRKEVMPWACTDPALEKEVSDI